MEQNYDNCFVCGKDNSIGLKMKFSYANNIAQSSFNLSELYEGYDKIIHGGIIAAILDEAMAKAILFKKIKAVTVNLNVSYKKILKPNHLYIVEGYITTNKKKTILTQASIFDGNTIYATATAKFFVLKDS